MYTLNYVLDKIIYHQYEHCINNIVYIPYLLYVFNKYVGPTYQKEIRSREMMGRWTMKK